MDIISIKQLQLKTTIGAYSWERYIKQSLYVDLDVGLKISCHEINDDLEKTLDYAKLQTQLIDFASEQQCKLIETFASNIVELLAKQYPIQWLKVRVAKPGALNSAKEVAVILERQF